MQTGLAKGNPPLVSAFLPAHTPPLASAGSLSSTPPPPLPSAVSSPTTVAASLLFCPLLRTYLLTVLEGLEAPVAALLEREEWKDVRYDPAGVVAAAETIEVEHVLVVLVIDI